MAQSSPSFRKTNRKRILLRWHQDWNPLPNHVSEDMFITQLHSGVCSSCPSSHSSLLSARVHPGGYFPFSFLTYISVTWCKFYLLFFVRMEGKYASLSLGFQPSWLEKRKVLCHSKCRQQEQRCLFYNKCCQTCLTNLIHTTSGFRLLSLSKDPSH